MKEKVYQPEDFDHNMPAFVCGMWYQFAVPGGFLMEGQYVRALGGDMHRMANVRHMRNAGKVELPAMTQKGSGPETKWTEARWPLWQGVVLWFTPIRGGLIQI